MTLEVVVLLLAAEVDVSILLPALLVVMTCTAALVLSVADALAEEEAVIELAETGKSLAASIVESLEAVVMIILPALLVSVPCTSASVLSVSDELDEELGVELAEAGTSLTKPVVESCDPECVLASEVLPSSALVSAVARSKQRSTVPLSVSH